MAGRLAGWLGLVSILVLTLLFVALRTGEVDPAGSHYSAYLIFVLFHVITEIEIWEGGDPSKREGRPQIIFATE